MKLRQPVMTGDEIRDKLRKRSIANPADQPVMVYMPALPNALPDRCLLLEGYAHQAPVAYNITRLYSLQSNSDRDDILGSVLPGTWLIGCILGKKFFEDAISGKYNTLDEWLIADPSGANLFFNELMPFPMKKYILGFPEEKGMRFFHYDGKGFSLCRSELYSLKLDVFSRNSGILETEMMMTKTAIISGCGSVGSYVALELARSGVGRFLLIDHDVLSYTNVCRHQCGIADVGRYKTLALADRIRLINPAATVATVESPVENTPPDIFDRFCGPDSVIIGCADNRQGDLFACKVAAHYNMPMVSIGFWERAFAGEVFYWIPDQISLACYHCFTQALGDISQRESVNRRFYTSQQDLSKVAFMPGISVDITFVSNIGTKIIIDILNRNDEKFPPRLIDSLTQFTLIANTNKPELGGEQAGIFSYPLQVTTSIEVEKINGCKYCGHKTP